VSWPPRFCRRCAPHDYLPALPLPHCGWQAYKLARSGRLPTTRLGARDLHVPAAVLRRIEQEGLPPVPDGGEVA
jgi:hypothetical protein